MQLPEYWLARPPQSADESARAAFDALWADTLARGEGGHLDYTLPWPKWEFVCHLSDHHGVAAHGSGDAGIDEFEPRQPDDLTEFGNQNAVYAASDGLWAMFFAIVDRDRVPSIANACIRVEDDSGVTGPLYVFSISRTALPLRPWRAGTLYLLPRSPFVQQPPMELGAARIHIDQLASFQPVRPLARIAIDPEDFPFLALIRGHDDARLQEYADALAGGAPWPDDEGRPHRRP